MPEGARVPVPSGLERLLKAAAADLILRPWFDQITLNVLLRWYFPLSRAWAAALAAGGSRDRFFSQLPGGRRTDRLIEPLLKRCERRRAALASVEARWEEAFFGEGPASAELEIMRIRAAGALMGMRTLFAPLQLEKPFPPIAWAIEDLRSVERRHTHRLFSPEKAFLPRSEPTAIEASRGYRSRHAIEGWIRFPCPVPSVGDYAWARVCMPPALRRRGVGVSEMSPDVMSANPNGPSLPTLIFAHGIAVETEFWVPKRDPLSDLSQVGIRVLRPEAPWHGRRRRTGFYGGEPILAFGPGGLLDFFHAAVLEIGALVAWARATRRGPVAVGGVSLGALTAQLVATAAHRWPAAMRPDALFLVAPAHSMTAVAFEGSLCRGLGLPPALASAGWPLEATKAWLPLLGSQGSPVVPPEHIVVVLGLADDVTLAESGEDLVADWHVPAENVFRCGGGHFSTSLGLSRDEGPLRQFTSMLSKLAA